jgi:hypothetical protein
LLILNVDLVSATSRFGVRPCHCGGAAPIRCHPTKAGRRPS